jgi:Mrp family chromosome partitioning ATPase
MRKPACYKLLGMRQATNGLQDVLEGRIAWTDAVVQDKKSGLYLLLERKGRKDSGDLLSSAQMKQLVEQAREQYDYVLLDLPPMAGVSDGEAALKYSDASLLVVRQNAAPAPALNKAIAALEQGHTRLLGCVLNDVYTSGLYSYGYGYGYGYGKYGRYGQYGQYGHYGTADENE